MGTKKIELIALLDRAQDIAASLPCDTQRQESANVPSDVRIQALEQQVEELQSQLSRADDEIKLLQGQLDDVQKESEPLEEQLAQTRIDFDNKGRDFNALISVLDAHLPALYTVAVNKYPALRAILPETWDCASLSDKLRLVSFFSSQYQGPTP